MGIMKGSPRIILLVIFTGLFLSYGACGAPNGYSMMPSDTGAYLPVNQVMVDFWDLPPGIMILFMVLLVFAIIGFPLEIYLLVKFYAYFGYRKIARKTILQNTIRNQIFTAIRDHPGINHTMLLRITGVNRGTLRYHLRILKLTGKITIFATGDHPRYFENSGKYSDGEKTLLKYLMNKTDDRIFRALLDSPDLTRVDLEAILGVRPSTISWRMNRLIKKQLISTHTRDKTLHYEISPGVRQYVEKYLATPIPAAPPVVPGQVSGSA